MVEYDPNEWLTTRQAADLAGKNRRTIVNWIRAGQLPAVRLPGSRGQYKIRKSDLETVLTQPVTSDEA